MYVNYSYAARFLNGQTSEKEVFPDALAARTMSPTLTLDMAFSAPDCRETVSEAAKHENLLGVGALLGADEEVSEKANPTLAEYALEFR